MILSAWTTNLENEDAMIKGYSRWNMKKRGIGQVITHIEVDLCPTTTIGLATQCIRETMGPDKTTEIHGAGLIHQWIVWADPR
jgi:hypothetical protein